MLIDSHLHLTQLALSEITRPGYAQLLTNPFLSVSTDFADSCKNLAFAVEAAETTEFPQARFAIGLHPWMVTADWSTEIAQLAGLLPNPNIDAFGEIGLDFSTQHKATAEQQLQAFEQQLKLAIQYDLPVSMHIFKAYDAGYQLLQKYPVTGVLHGFAGGLQQAKRFTQLGLKIGIGANILRANAPKYWQLVQGLDLTEILLETDAPDGLTAIAKQPNLAAYLTAIAHKISQLKQLEFKVVSATLNQTCREIFNFDEPR